MTLLFGDLYLYTELYDTYSEDDFLYEKALFNLEEFIDASFAY